MLLMFLLLKIEKDEEITQLLQSMKFSTLALNIFKIPGFEHIRDALSDAKKAEEKEGLEKNMGLIGFDKGYFVADFIYLLTLVGIVAILHLLFFLSIRVPKEPMRLVENVAVTVDHFFNYSFYIRFSLSFFFYMLIAIFHEFKQVEMEWRRMISFIVALGAFVYLLLFFVFVLKHFIKNKDKPYDPRDRYQVLYQGLKETRWAKFFYSIYLMRRILLAILIFIPAVLFQLIAISIIQIASFCYMINVRPYITKQDNMINAINEFIVVICTFIFISISENGDPDHKRVGVKAVIYIVSGSGVVVCIIIMGFAYVLIYDFLKAYLEKRRMEKILELEKGRSIDSGDLSSSVARESGFDVAINVSVSNSQNAYREDY